MSVIKSQHLYLPKKHLDYTKWAVIGCEQFANDAEYWDTVKNYVSGSPSAYDLIFPEINFKSDWENKIQEINKNMASYYQGGLFEDIGPCMVLVNRTTKNHQKRLGLVMTVDLEKFSTIPSNPSLIKASEGSFVDRIPPRVEMRKNSILELSNIVVLYDDRKIHIADNLYARKSELEPLYNFNLNLDGGHIEGYKVKNVEGIIRLFDQLLTPEYLQETFKTKNQFLFAVADGNQSLVTAKEHWNNIKKMLTEDEQSAHPARYALVEAINIHDDGVELAPIHRIVMGAKKNFLKGLKKLFKVNAKKMGEKDFVSQKIFIGEQEDTINLPSNTPLAIKLVQDYIDKCSSKQIEMCVDYIKSEEELKQMCKIKRNAIGITFPRIKKQELFEFIIKNGPLPRRAFAMGEPREKRYYLEAHKIRLI